MTIYQQFSPGVVTIRTTTAQGSGWVYSGDGIHRHQPSRGGN